MHGVVEGSMIRVMAPKVRLALRNQNRKLDSDIRRGVQWSYKLPIHKLRHVDVCYREFGLYIREAIAERRQLASDPRESEAGRKDLLGALLYASADLDDESEGEDRGSEKKRATLTDDELMGSMYLFLLAGHGESAPLQSAKSTELNEFICRNLRKHACVRLHPACAVPRRAREAIRARFRSLAARRGASALVFASLCVSSLTSLITGIRGLCKSGRTESFRAPR